MKERFSSVFAACLLVSMVLACTELRKKNATRQSTPDFEISADQLAKEFKENPSAADTKYAGKTLAITGRVDGTLLGTSLIFAGNRQHGFATQCFFDKKDADSIKRIKSGTEVTVLGVCMGRDKNDGPLAITQCIVQRMKE